MQELLGVEEDWCGEGGRWVSISTLYMLFIFFCSFFRNILPKKEENWFGICVFLLPTLQYNYKREFRKGFFPNPCPLRFFRHYWSPPLSIDILCKGDHYGAQFLSESFISLSPPELHAWHHASRSCMLNTRLPSLIIYAIIFSPFPLSSKSIAQTPDKLPSQILFY